MITRLDGDNIPRIELAHFGKCPCCNKITQLYRLIVENHYIYTCESCLLTVFNLLKLKGERNDTKNSTG